MYLPRCLPVILYFLCALSLSHPAVRLSEQHTALPTQTAPGQAEKKVINLNNATLEELQSLPGIGPATAKSILAYRRKNPPFRKVDDLLIIKGISKRRLDLIRNRVCVK
jgi:comEA protein